MSDFPQAVAAINSCHIRIKAPNKNPGDYIEKEYRSHVASWSFGGSPLKKDCQKRSFLPINMLKQIGNVELSPLILGDSTYSLGNWLMKPYSDRRNLSLDETKFNLALTTSLVVVEKPFGRFKGRFQCISKRLAPLVMHTVNTATCSILHNFYIITKRRFLHEWLQQSEVDLVKTQNNSRCVEVLNEAESIRNAIRDYLAHHWSLFLNIFINKRTVTVGKYIVKSLQGKGKDKN